MLWQIKFAVLAKLSYGNQQAAGEPSLLSRAAKLIAYYLVVAALVEDVLLRLSASGVFTPTRECR